MYGTHYIILYSGHIKGGLDHSQSMNASFTNGWNDSFDRLTYSSPDSVPWCGDK